MDRTQFKNQVGYELGSPEATNALLESSKKLLAPTAGEVYKPFVAPTEDKNIDFAINQGLGMYDTKATTPINEDTIRSQTLSRFQQEIDAVNAVYGEKLREAKTQGLSRLGSTNAINARSGTLGSDFGQAQNEKVVGMNNDIENSVEAERLAKIALINRAANTDATAEIAAKRKAQEEGLDSYIKFLGAKTERKTAGLKKVAGALISQKLDPSEIDPANLEAIAKSYGVTVDELKQGHATEKKAYEEAELAKMEASAKNRRVEVGEGQAIYELQDDGTYKLIGKNPKTSSPGSGDKLSLSEARSLGLPISLVNQSQDAVLASLDSKNPPNWFIEKMGKDLAMDPSLVPQILNPVSPLVTNAWKDYQAEVKASYEKEDVSLQQLVEMFSQPAVPAAE